MKKFLEKGSRIRSNSLGDIGEVLKRKREENEQVTVVDEQIFKRSSKTNRTPIKSDTNTVMEEILKRLEILTDIQRELKEIKESNNVLQVSNNKIREEFKIYREEVEKENKKLKLKVKDLEEKVLKIVDDVEKKEKQERKNNIIFTVKMDTELKEDQVKLKNYLQEKCRQLANTKIELQEIYYIAKNRKGMDIFRTRVNNFERASVV